MTRYNLLAAVAIVWASLMAPRAVHAAESYDNCTGFITSLPATISTQGTWCLKQDLSTAITSGEAITVNANNVILDCNHFKLGGLAAGLTTFVDGVYTNDHFNVTVRRCSIRGFFRGILFLSTTGSSGGGHVIEDNRFDGNTFGGAVIMGDGSVIRRNRIYNTGGSTVQAAAYGVYSVFSIDIFDNIIAGVASTNGDNGWASGIRAVSPISTRTIGNAIRGVVADGTGNAEGISIQTDDHVVIRSNDLAGDAAAGSRGITCAFGANSSARDNVISGFASPIVICTDGGGNDIVP